MHALNDIGVVIIRLNNERSSVAFYVTDFALHGLERMFRWYVHERLSFGIRNDLGSAYFHVVYASVAIKGREWFCSIQLSLERLGFVES